MIAEPLTTFDSFPLSAIEAESLQQCEAVIERGRRTFLEVGNALACIRDHRLYRVTHRTFEEYCGERWDLTRSHAYRMIDAAAVVANLSPIGDIPLPRNEAQARALAPVPPEQRPAAWERAAATAPEGRVTAAHVAAVVRVFLPAPVENPEPAPLAPPTAPAPAAPAAAPYGFCTDCGIALCQPFHVEARGGVCPECFSRAIRQDKPPGPVDSQPDRLVHGGPVTPPPLTEAERAAKLRDEERAAEITERYERACEVLWEEATAALESGAPTPLLDHVLAAEEIHCWRCAAVVPDAELAELHRLAGWNGDAAAMLPSPGVCTAAGTLWTAGDAHYCAGCGPGVAVCRQCGCTDENPCDEGCQWIAADLCSACEPPPPEPPAPVRIGCGYGFAASDARLLTELLALGPVLLEELPSGSFRVALGEVAVLFKRWEDGDLQPYATQRTNGDDSIYMGSCGQWGKVSRLIPAILRKARGGTSRGHGVARRLTDEEASLRPCDCCKASAGVECSAQKGGSGKRFHAVRYEWQRNLPKRSEAGGQR